MATTFGTTTLVGTAGQPEVGAWVLAETSTTYFDIEGVSDVTGATHGREIRLEHWLHNSYANRAAVETAFKNLEKLIGTTKTLTDGIGQVFKNSKLVSILPRVGPVFSPPLDWMYVLEFTWRQLKK